MNASDRDQVLTEGTTLLGRCEPVTWATPVDGSAPQTPETPGLYEHLQEAVSGARTNVNYGEAREFEKLIIVQGVQT
jgi:hypothetical protein